MTRLVRLYAFALLFAMFLHAIPAMAQSAPDYIWLEGEGPKSVSPADLRPAIESGPHDVLSGEKWLKVAIDPDKVPSTLTPDQAKAGIVLSYDFTATNAGDYDLWMHVGFEQARSLFSWRIDSGSWHQVERSTHTIDVQELGVWAPVAWMNLGKATISGGNHTLEITIPVSTGKDGKYERVLFGIDAVCLSSKPFHPDGPMKPGDPGSLTDADKAAAAKVFQLPGAAGPSRVQTSLEGPWQYAQDDEMDIQDRLGPTESLTDPATLHWRAFDVPGDRNHQLRSEKYVHRFDLRTRVNVPKELDGRSFILHFADINLIATVFVNGKQAAWVSNPGTAWDCDLTGFVKAGQVNDLTVVVKDPFYGLEPQEDAKHLNYVPYDFWHFGTGYRLDMVTLGRYFTGILRLPPTLVAAGPAYTADVFAKPTVAARSLGLEVTVHNPTDSALDVTIGNRVEPLGGGPAEKTFAPKTVSVPAKQDVVINLVEPWANPRLWWPDDAQQYNVVTQLSVGGQVIDETKTKFGFREWTWDGPEFKLNGIPWHGFADCNTADIPTLKSRGQTMVRVWTSDETTEKYLEECDAKGMIVRRTGIFDGEGVAGFYDLKNQHLWDNYRRQMVAWIKSQRNHPSIFMWSIENEITFINGACLGNNAVTTPQIKKSYETFKDFDPTRPEMVDGGNALLDESMPVYGGHYMEPPFNTFPEGIYDKEGYAHRQAWPITQAKPIVFGEAEYLAGTSLTDMATVGGEEAAIGTAESRPARAIILRMLSEGYRWNGISFQFWTGNEVPNYYKAWSPVAVLCRQWNWSFGSAQKIKRTLGIFNDTRSSDPLTLTTTLSIGDKRISQESSVHHVAAGGNEKFDCTLTLPAVSQREEATWTIQAARGTQIVFEDVKNVSILPDAAAILRANPPAAGSIAVFDPVGGVRKFVAGAGMSATVVEDLNKIPDSVKVLIIGNDALDASTSTSSMLSAWASAGRAVIILEQKNPLKYQGLPGEMSADVNHGCLAFAEDLTTPLFSGIQQKDMSNWGPDNWTYRNAYVKPVSGGKSLVQCDTKLKDAAMVQMQVGKGVLVLSQLLIGEMLRDNAVAQRLLVNMIKYGESYRLKFNETAVVAAGNPQLLKALDASGLQYQPATDPISAISKPGTLAVIDASPQNLEKLAGAKPQVDAFTSAGGWIIFNRLTPEGLASFNKLVEVQHIIRPYRLEKVTYPIRRHPLTGGLPASDVVLGSGKTMSQFNSTQWPDANGYSYVVDFDDAAPFASSTYGAWNNAVNGFTQKDGAWQLIQNLLPQDAVMPIHLSKPEKIQQITWCSDNNYEGCTRIEVQINDRKYAFDTEPNGDEQTFDIPDQPTASDLVIRIADWQHLPNHGQNGKELVGIDNVWIKVARPDGFFDKVKPMLNIGAMVEYPRGKGGIILCNVKFQDSETNPENMHKKQTIISTLLRNLDAPFTGGKTIIAGGNLDFTPIDISKQANQYRGEQGWFGDAKHTFAALPAGRQTMAGVTYDIYHFNTSIVPEAIMLGGPGIPGHLHESVQGIPVNQKADALFFLQTARIDTKMTPKDIKDQKRFDTANYIVHYSDGSTQTIPVYSEVSVNSYHQESPVAIPGAQIAWQQAYDGGEGFAVAYSMQWNNPRPDLEIVSIDMTYGKNRRGVLALLAVTAAKQR